VKRVFNPNACTAPRQPFGFAQGRAQDKQQWWLNDDLTFASHMKKLLVAFDHPLSPPHSSSPGKQRPAIALANQVNAGQQ
jgi:hypothetical protein